MDWADELITRFEDELEDVYKIEPPEGWRTLVESLLEYVKWQNNVHDTSVRIYSIEKKRRWSTFSSTSLSSVHFRNFRRDLRCDTFGGNIILQDV